MAAPQEGFRSLLIDPTFWGPRLRRLSEEPRHLVQIPRDDLARPGFLVLELRLRGYDGAPLQGLLSRWAFQADASQVQLRTTADLQSAAVDWRAVEEGATDLVFAFPPRRKLEDRVLDVLRVAEAASSLTSVDPRGVSLYRDCRPPGDEFVIADLVRERAWS